MATLYELKNEYLELLAMAENEELDPQTIRDTLEGIEGEIGDKAEAYAIIINELLAKADRIDKEVARLDGWVDSLRNNAASMKNILMDTLDVLGVKKIETEHFRIGIAGNGGKKPLRITGDVPESYTVMKPEIDVARIRDELEKGEELPFAHLEERGRHLSIR